MVVGRVLNALGCALAILVGLVGFPVSGQQQDLPPLEEVLDRLTRVADVYAGNALKFTAEEVTRVRNEFGTPGTPRKLNVVSVYSYYRDDDGTLRDRRVRKSAMKKLGKAETFEEIERLTALAGDPMSERQGLRGEHRVPAFLDRPYSWILLFSKKSRKDYDYEIDVAGEPNRILVRFRPKPGRERDIDWHGSVLVDRGTWQIVRAEGIQTPDRRERALMQAMLDSPEDTPLDPDDRTFIVRKVSTKFDLVEHGMRFPSRVQVEVLRHRVSGLAGAKRVKTVTAATIVQTYRNYRFYDVDVTTDFLAR